MHAVSFFDFSEEVRRTVSGADHDDATRLTARTTVGRAQFPRAVSEAGFTLLKPGQLFSPATFKDVLVVCVTTWSDPDLALLETLAKVSRELAVFVVDLDDWSLQDILKDLPRNRKASFHTSCCALS